MRLVVLALKRQGGCTQVSINRARGQRTAQGEAVALLTQEEKNSLQHGNANVDPGGRADSGNWLKRCVRG